jgi:hypothetical protein
MSEAAARTLHVLERRFGSWPVYCLPKTRP